MPAGHGMTEAQSSRAQRHWEGAFAAMYGLLRTPIHWRGLLKTWLDRAREHPAAHPSYAGAIGYCLGGQSILEQVRAGHDLQVSVSRIVFDFVWPDAYRQDLTAGGGGFPRTTSQSPRV